MGVAVRGQLNVPCLKYRRKFLEESYTVLSARSRINRIVLLIELIIVDRVSFRRFCKLCCFWWCNQKGLSSFRLMCTPSR